MSTALIVHVCIASSSLFRCHDIPEVITMNITNNCILAGLVNNKTRPRIHLRLFWEDHLRDDVFSSYDSA